MPADGVHKYFPRFSCLGHEWELGVYVRESGNTGMCLQHRSATTNISIELLFVIGGRLGPKVSFSFDHNHTICRISLNREDVLKALMHGSLMIEVRIKKPNDHRLPPLIPQNPSECKTVQCLFMDEESADVIFEVGGRRPIDELGSKRSKTEGTTFFAHHNILKTAAPLLAELCTSNESPTRIQLPDVSPQLFHYMLCYIYGCNIPDFRSDLSHAKEIISLADKFGVTKLKIAVEVSYVTSTTIDFDNVMESLQFAVSKNCALLKEAVMEFVAKNKVEILEKQTMMDAPGGLIHDILAVILRGEMKCGADVGTGNELSTMSVSELRRTADRYGLDIDGSREMLISAIKQYESESSSSSS